MTATLPNPPPRWERHVVLVAPDVHWNTGNIGRTCLGAGARLHLIHPLGFSLDDRAVRRAGLDYWPRVNPTEWKTVADFIRAMSVLSEELAVFTKNGRRPFWKMPAPERLFLVFGSETRGLPADFLSAHWPHTYHIPISRDIRSLNLSTAAGIALYESLRRMPVTHAWPCAIP